MKTAAGGQLSPLAKKALKAKRPAAATSSENRRTSRPEHSALHALLILACPAQKSGEPGSISGTLAPALDVSFQSVYQWIRRNQLPPKQVLPLVRVAEGRVSKDQFLAFVI